MKAFLSAIIDKLQATFPPNRLMLFLAGPITAASIWVSGTVAANIPGVNLPVGVVAGIIAAAALITIRLIDRWFDQWQKGEPIDYGADVEQALNELAENPDPQAFFAALGTLQGTGASLEDLRQKIMAGTIEPADVAASLGDIGGVIVGFLEQHTDAPPAPPVASPPAEAVPPAAPQPAE